MIEPHNQIIITQDFDTLRQNLQESIEKENLDIIETDELKIEHAKEIISKAYKATKTNHYIVVFANKFNIYAQNALLKILEEPPDNISIVLCAKNRSLFLPTILSRLPQKIFDQKIDKEDLEFERFDLERLYELVHNAKFLSKADAKALIKAMLHFAIKQNYALNERELDYFAHAIKLIDLNSNVANVLLTAGLILLTHKKRGK
ncbi:DNA polymerase III subunit delta' [Nitratiruptor sp. YY09-18]|uniref:DNA polymerase III subunit delta' n=1 Tax=Nitratiruptor sp. YY09-18 TaxID=2724901 RepID=UPI001916BC7C|nr:DNA polymerase III subunit delta' [Nitratiruptor sp. YY09-18]BCD67865.1 DNA polymerase III subunit delta' [Nitratiruptor sp. YY09-18]